jgi:hypothetical protein
MVCLLAGTSIPPPCPEQGGKLLGLLLAGSTGQHMAGAGVSDLLVVALETPSPHVPQVVLRDVGQP